MRLFTIPAGLLPILAALLAGLWPTEATATDLRITKEVSSQTVTVGDRFTYSLTVDNGSTTGGGPFDSPETLVIDDLPEELMFVEATTTAGSCTVEGQQVTCELGTVPKNTTVTITITVEALADGTVTNGANVAGSLFDPDESNNTDSAVVVIEKATTADLGIAKSAPDEVLEGSTFDFTLTVTNNGPSESTNTRVQDRVSAAFVIESVTAGQGSCTVGNDGTIDCNLGTLAPGASTTVTIRVTAAIDGTYTNEAAVGGDLVDLNDTDNIDTATVTVIPDAADLALTKTASANVVGVGEPFTYTLTVTNNGPQDARDVVVSDLLPTSPFFPDAPRSVNVDSAYTDAAGTTCTIGDAEVTCPLGTLEAGATVTITLLARARGLEDLYNVAEVTSSGPPDPDDLNNLADLETTVRGAQSVKNHPESGHTRDPVSTLTGELFHDEPEDLFLDGPLPLRFDRYYGSFLQRDGWVESALGPNWAHAFDWRLRVEEETAYVVSPRGEVVIFWLLDGTWQQATNPGYPYQLVPDGASFVFGDPRSRRQLTFDVAGTLTQIADDRGNTLTLSYDGAQLQTVTDGLDRALTFTYDGTGRLSRVSDGDRAVTFSYTDGLLTSATNVLGDVVSYAYDQAHPLPGLMTGLTRPRGNVPYTQTYDSEGRVVSQEDALGNRYTLAYADDEETGESTTTVTNPLGQSIQHRHDAQGLLLSHTDEAGRTIAVDYDEAGRRRQVTDRNGQVVTFTFHEASGFPASFSWADGSTATLTYTPRAAGPLTFYDLDEIRYPDGTVEAFTYDSRGNLTEHLDRAGGRWAYTHDDQGNVLTMTNPLGGVYTFSYASNALLASLEDPAGNTTQVARDAFGRITELRYPDETTRTFTYDAHDNLRTVTDERGLVTTFGYDANGNLTTITNPLAQQTGLTYDALDRLTRVQDAQGNASTRTYDALGRIEHLTDRNGQITALAFNAVGHPVTITDPEGHPWTRTYDAEGVLASQTDPAGSRTQYLVDSRSRVEQIVSPLARTTSYAYDEMSRVTRTALDDFALTFSYDARGDLTASTFPDGTGITYQRDALGAVTERRDANQHAWSRSYDASGRLQTTTDPLGRATTYAYDARNRLATVQFPEGLGTLTLSYDALGQLTRKAYSDGTDLTFAYDDAGRLTEATGVSFQYDNRGALVDVNGLALTRDAAGRVTTLALAPGKTIEYGYNQRDQVTTVRDWAGGTTTLSYDDVGRLITIERPNGTTATYDYDRDSRLIAVAEMGADTLASIRLDRDPRGRVTQARRSVPLAPMVEATRTEAQYDAASQMEGLTYDALGRLVDDGMRRYTWNLDGRLAQVDDGAQTTSYQYDAFGRRLARTAGATTQQYVWNDALQLPSMSVVREDEADRRYYVHTPAGVLLYSIEAADSSRVFYHFDELGNTLFLTDDAGSITDRYAYAPFGQPAGTEGSHATLFRWGGAYGTMYDAETGLYYLRARYYDPAHRRFVSRDPLHRSLHPNEINPYGYARNNPLLYTDPFGTNARVNQSGVHTDVSVDVWEGDQVIGVLTVSYAAKGYTGQFGGVGEAFCTVVGGTQGEFSVDFKPGERIAQDPLDTMIARGTQTRDERMGVAMLKAVLNLEEDEAPDARAFDLLRRVTERHDESLKRSFNLTVTSMGYWQTYRAVSQSCNDFSDAMLDAYFGENWNWGPIFTGDGLVDEFQDRRALDELQYQLHVLPLPR